ncbi:serine/threonine protein phosphatase [Flavobacterium sp. xlx-214]|uniref:metallophosphoesterase family protein n=1 Tax=unclassified Flavobacterium TaxID=196869 RepID=UPI0013D62469|nr:MULTISPECIES: metallophosphoesterase family protein [unclassified Flavobacterium]MBA5793643.1 serine/threonine protein phosphatase [Flavobacterium sp. xlx-221]QMI84571.1 serine/threonine protein phosphatase [Flavobacterium sp. xlx-214]
MTNTYVIGDIHGGLKALLQVLERANVTPNDTLIFLGDYADGWSETPKVIDFLIDLATKQKCIFMQGNHEEMLLKWLRKEDDNELWRFHGGEVSVQAYQNIPLKTIEKHITFLENLNEFYIDDENRLFVHAGFTHLKGVTFEYFRGMLWWDRTLWETAMAVEGNLSTNDVRYPGRLKLYKEIFVGHTPVIRFGASAPMNFANVWNIDTGAAFTGKLSILNVNTKEYWQSDVLPSLYPNEKGRN